MAQTAQTICTLARQIAKCPNYTTQSGQLLNVVLQELAQTYDFEVARGTYNFNFTPATVPIGNLNAQLASGPFPLPTDYLRTKRGDVMWFLQQVPYPLIPIDLEEFDVQVQQAGLQSYPYLWTTDMAQSPPVAYVWPPASGTFPCMVRYYKQMPDITAPETSTSAPWFPNQTYLITRLAGELMKITDDERYQTYLGKGDTGAEGILTRYLKLQGDKSDRSQRVHLDRRRFGRAFSVLQNTKRIGW